MNIAPFSALACPLDGAPLHRHGAALRCARGHSFDLASQGYVNLLPVQNKRSLDPGDSKAMVAARRRYLASGIYEPIAAMVARNAALASSSVVVVDALISVPTVLIALILAVPLGASIAVIVIACGFGYGLNLARVARPAALLASRSSYVESALANGASGWRVLISHVMPNILPVLAVQLSLSAGTAVLAESGLTYLGIGVPSGVPSWGHSLATSVKLINVFPLTVVWPGLIVTVVVVALNIFGDVLRDAIDPVTNPALREIGGER